MKQGLFAADFQTQLTNRLQKRLGFDVADGTADLDDHHVESFPHQAYAAFDLIRDVWDDLPPCRPGNRPGARAGSLQRRCCRW